MDVSGTQTLSDVLEQRVAAHPDKDFLVFEADDGSVATLSYRAFASRVDRIANALSDRDVRPGDRVAVMLSNCPDFIVCWFAITQAGAIMVPVNVLYAPDELRYLLDTTEAVALVTEPKFMPTFRQIAEHCRHLRLKWLARSQDSMPDFDALSDIERAASPDHRVVAVEGDAPAQIIFTSGTTSRPKGAILSHRATVVQGIATAMLFGLRHDDRCCVVLPLFHVNGQYVGVMPTLTVGGTVVLLETFSARNYWNQVRRHRCTGISIVPMILRTMLLQPPSETDSKHDVRFSFYALPTSSEEWTHFENRFGVRLIEGYGLSETLGICSSNPVVHGVTKRHCIGLPLLGCEMRVVDENGKGVPRGQVGQIQVKGPALFSGYYANPEETRACMTDGWFSTGDNASIDGDGYFHFFDRSKDVIKRAGENISASEVERVLTEHPGIAEAAVIGVFDPLRDEAVKAFVVVQAGVSLTESDVKEWCARHLAKFKVPSFCEFRSSLPRTSIGKIMKHQLKAEEKNARALNA
ncbi:AMP-binding protein [Bosea sp. (in: a-proteobacteria)]|uniref:AMP-binding protein n=1 Tax=Bosea sp. (in: a-proteobacteria) TaxID=1871050 RepID=UPI003B3A8A2A